MLEQVDALKEDGEVLKGCHFGLQLQNETVKACKCDMLAGIPFQFFPNIGLAPGPTPTMYFKSGAIGRWFPVTLAGAHSLPLMVLGTFILSTGRQVESREFRGNSLFYF